MILTVTLNPSLDRTIFVNRLAQHDANRIQKVQEDAGGKGINVSRIARQLDAPTVALFFSGGPTGRKVEDVLLGENVEILPIPIAAETRTNYSIEELEVEHPPTSLNDRGPNIGKQEIDRFFVDYRQLLTEASWVVLAGSAPPVLPRTIYQELLSLARTQGRPVVVDADGELLTHAMELGPDLVKPNQDEAGRLLQRPIESDDDAIRAVIELKEKLGPGKRAILSLGSKGALLATDAGLWRGVPPAIEAKSTVGSGDSLIGGFLSSLLRGDKDPVAFQWGIASGSATATSDGSELGKRNVIELLFDDVRIEQLG